MKDRIHDQSPESKQPVPLGERLKKIPNAIFLGTSTLTALLTLTACQKEQFDTAVREVNNAVCGTGTIFCLGGVFILFSAIIPGRIAEARARLTLRSRIAAGDIDVDDPEVLEFAKKMHRGNTDKAIRDIATYFPTAPTRVALGLPLILPRRRPTTPTETSEEVGEEEEYEDEE